MALLTAITRGSTFPTRTRAGLLGPSPRGRTHQQRVEVQYHLGSGTTAYLQVVQVAAHTPLRIQLLAQLVHLAVQPRHTGSGLRTVCNDPYE